MYCSHCCLLDGLASSDLSQDPSSCSPIHCSLWSSNWSWGGRREGSWKSKGFHFFFSSSSSSFFFDLFYPTLPNLSTNNLDNRGTTRKSMISFNQPLLSSISDSGDQEVESSTRLFLKTMPFLASWWLEPILILQMPVFLSFPFLSFPFLQTFFKTCCLDIDQPSNSGGEEKWYLSKNLL